MLLLLEGRDGWTMVYSDMKMRNARSEAWKVAYPKLRARVWAHSEEFGGTPVYIYIPTLCIEIIFLHGNK